MSDTDKTKFEEYTKLAKISLVRMQYSCCGNGSNIDQDEYLPIVDSKAKTPNNEDKTKNT